LVGLINILLGLTSSILGKLIVIIPFSKIASAFSASTLVGNEIALTKDYCFNSFM